MSKLNNLITKNLQNSLVEKLEKFARKENFNEKMSLSFGDGDYQSFQSKWTKGQVHLPKIAILKSEEIGGGLGAYSQETQTIYLAQELLRQKENNNNLVLRVMLEEYGHYLYHS